jgi:hypothetical protein
MYSDNLPSSGLSNLIRIAMTPVDRSTYVPRTYPPALRKFVQPSCEPTDAEDPARDGKRGHTFASSPNGDSGLLPAPARVSPSLSC